MELVTVSLCLEQSMEPHARSQWILAAISLLLGRTFSRMLIEVSSNQCTATFELWRGNRLPYMEKPNSSWVLVHLCFLRSCGLQIYKTSVFLVWTFCTQMVAKLTSVTSCLPLVNTRSLWKDRPSSLTKYARLCWYGKSVCHPWLKQLCQWELKEPSCAQLACWNRAQTNSLWLVVGCKNPGRYHQREHSTKGVEPLSSAAHYPERHSACLLQHCQLYCWYTFSCCQTDLWSGTKNYHFKGAPTSFGRPFARSVTGLTETERMDVCQLLAKFSDVFSAGPHDLGCTDLVKHHIDTGSSKPVRQPPRRLPWAKREDAEKWIQEMQERVIEPSSSPWSSPVVLVQKKDGTNRFCVDYRRLNEVTHKDSYPLPRIDDTIDALSGVEWFSTLDLKSGYWQVQLDESSKEKTAFSTGHGLWQFKVMPFGLCNGPATLNDWWNKYLPAYLCPQHLCTLMISWSLDRHSLTNSPTCRKFLKD